LATLRNQWRRGVRCPRRDVPNTRPLTVSRLLDALHAARCIKLPSGSTRIPDGLRHSILARERFTLWTSRRSSRAGTLRRHSCELRIADARPPRLPPATPISSCKTHHLRRRLCIRTHPRSSCCLRRRDRKELSTALQQAYADLQVRPKAAPAAAVAAAARTRTRTDAAPASLELCDSSCGGRGEIAKRHF